MYFIDYIKTYSSVNKKGEEIQEYVEPFNQTLFCSDAALNRFISDLKAEIARGNERHPRSMPLTLNERTDEQYNFYKQLTVRVNNDSDKTVCVVSLKKVLRSM